MGVSVALEDVGGEVDVHVRVVVVDVGVNVVLIAAVGVLLGVAVVAHLVPVFDFPLVEDLVCDMVEIHAVQGKMRHRVATVGHSRLEATGTIQFIEPNGKRTITDSWASKSIELFHRFFVRNEVSNCVSCDGCSQAVPCDSISKDYLHNVLEAVLLLIGVDEIEELLFDISEGRVEPTVDVALP